MWQKINPQKRSIATLFALLLLITSPPSPVAAQSLQTLQAAAQDGDSTAQFHLGQLYDAGTALPQDYAKAPSGTNGPPPKPCPRPRTNWAPCCVWAMAALPICPAPLI